MFLIFREYTSDRAMMLPVNNILFIQDHNDGGASIFTSIPMDDGSDKNRNFRSKQSVAELKSVSSAQNSLFDGALAQL